MVDVELAGSAAEVVAGLGTRVGVLQTLLGFGTTGVGIAVGIQKAMPFPLGAVSGHDGNSPGAGAQGTLKVWSPTSYIPVVDGMSAV